MASLTGQVMPKTVAILGGGISGLSAAYYISKKLGPKVKLVLLEGSNRTGGWVQTLKKDNNILELGPQTIRPAGVPGQNTLDLIHDLGLDTDVCFIPPGHSSTQNRFVIKDQKIVRLPGPKDKVMFKTVEPLDRPVIKMIMKELITPKKEVEDDSLYDFASRRLGKRIADYMIDPLVRGVCAGDSKKISAKFIIGPEPLRLEQQHGSVIRGALWKILRREKPDDPFADFPNVKEIGTSDISQTAKQHGWQVWSLGKGLASIPTRLEETLVQGGIDIHKEAPVKKIIFDGDGDNVIEYLDSKTNSIKQIHCSHIVSALPAHCLSTILEASSPRQSSLLEVLKTIQPVDVTLTKLRFSKQSLNYEGFGFLVPSIEKDLAGLLGVVFNTCVFPQGEDIVITAMSQGINVDSICNHVHKTLDLKDPDFVSSHELRECIPQYTVGHYERVKTIYENIKKSNLPLTLIGASYDGVSVNDCILSGRRASENLSSKNFTEV